MLILTALNLSISWRLFKIEITDHFASIEGAWIGIARYLSTHWHDFSWWPLWHCGMPYQDTYVPLVHVLAALTSSATHLPPGRGYHAVLGVTYALGPATLYLMALRLGAHRGAAFFGALTYSLFSPSGLLMPLMGADMGGWWFARRLQVMTAYGEGPHVSAMTLIPIVILAMQNAIEKRTLRALAVAAIACALVYLTNIPGTMALGLAVFCWIAAQPWTDQSRAWTVAGGASILGYALACAGVPPSSAFTVGGNVGSMHPGFSNSLRFGPIWLLLVFAAVFGLGVLLARIRLALVIRFSLLFFILVAPLAITARVETFELLPQVGRLHLEMEMGACLLIGAVGWAAYRTIPGWIRPVILALCVAPAFIQWEHYREHARRDISRPILEKHSEYTTARWLDANARGKRVYVAGSTSFWLNAFTDTPQLIGCCDQGLSMPVLNQLPYVVNPGTTLAHTEEAKVWLRALGVEALVVNGKDSTDEYKDIHNPERFDAVFRALHRENGDTIYAVDGPGSGAYALKPAELVPVRPRQKVAGVDVHRYAGAIADPASAVSIHWPRNNEARLDTSLQPDQIVSVQTAWFPGWKAYVNGASRPVAADGLGFLVIDPQCRGNCEITLRWTGRPDVRTAQAVSLLALIAIVGMMTKGVKYYIR